MYQIAPHAVAERQALRVRFFVPALKLRASDNTLHCRPRHGTPGPESPALEITLFYSSVPPGNTSDGQRRGATGVDGRGDANQGTKRGQRSEPGVRLRAI